MIVRLELQDAVHGRLCDEAKRRQVTIDQLIVEFAGNLPDADRRETPKRLSVIGIPESGLSDLGPRHHKICKATEFGDSGKAQPKR